MSRCFPSKSGFSLAEVTLALGIAGFCLVAVFGLMPVGVRTNRNATSQTAATNIVAAVVADLRATPNTINTSSQFAITFGTNKTLYFDGSRQAANSAAHDAVTENLDKQSAGIDARGRREIGQGTHKLDIYG